VALSEGVRTLALTAVVVSFAFAWMALRARRASGTPDELVAQLRLAQLAALVLVLTAGAYLGLAAREDVRAGVGLDVALALGYTVVAGVATTRDPREALIIVALAFASHALVDILHRPGALPQDLAPPWYGIGCAVHNLVMAAICYVPLLRR
jgi:hypothetical protein